MMDWAMIDWGILAQAEENRVSYFKILFLMCGSVGWFLWVLNAVTWALIIKYFMNIRRETFLPVATTAQLDEMFANRQYREVLELTQDDPSFIGSIVNSALSQASFGYSAMERAMEETAEQGVTRLVRSLEWLNLLGNVGPMLGLLGTVQGMIGAFFSIVALGKAEPAAMAGDIGVALVTTLEGLIIAVPALSTYAVMRNRIDSTSTEAMITAQKWLGQLRPAKKSG